MIAIDADALADEALNAACLAIQERLGVPDGDLAAQVFSDGAVKALLRAYIDLECAAEAEPFTVIGLYDGQEVFEHVMCTRSSHRRTPPWGVNQAWALALRQTFGGAPVPPGGCCIAIIPGHHQRHRGF